MLYKYVNIHTKHRDAQVLMFHLQLHASCTKTLAEPAVESHFLGHQVSLLKVVIFFSFHALLFLNHCLLNNLVKKSSLSLLLLNRHFYFLELRKKSLCHWKPYCTAFVHKSRQPKIS